MAAGISGKASSTMYRYFTAIAVAAAMILIADDAFSTDGQNHDETQANTEQGHSGMEGPGGAMIIMPAMDSAKGRKLYASKGCVVCHAINGIGGQDAPNLDAHTMSAQMNLLDFAARMWRGAATMIAMQEDELGEQIDFTGQELADIIAFVHDKNSSINSPRPMFRRTS